MAIGYFPIIGETTGLYVESDPSLDYTVVPYWYDVPNNQPSFGGTGGHVVTVGEFPVGTIGLPDQADLQLNEWQDMLDEIHAQGQAQQQQFDNIQAQTQRVLQQSQQQREEEARRQREQLEQFRRDAERARNQIEQDQNVINNTLQGVIEAVSRPAPTPPPEPEAKPTMKLPPNLGSINPITIAGAENIKDNIVSSAIGFGVGYIKNAILNHGKSKKSKKGKRKGGKK